MDKSTMKGIVIGATAAVALSGVAGYQALKAPTYADVLAVKEVTETIKVPRQECTQQTVQHQAPVKDEHQLTGTVLGAVVGGLVGNQVGGGNGKKLATVAGAAAGGYAGNQAQKNMQASDVTTTTENVCNTVYDSKQKNVGFDVTYKLGNKQDVVRLTYNPGKQIPVENGQLVINKSTPTETVPK